MTDMLSMYINVQHKTWDEILPYVTFAYNTAMQETHLVYGCEVQTMLEAMLPCDNIDHLDLAQDAELFAQRAEPCQLARVNIKSNRASMHAVTISATDKSSSNPVIKFWSDYSRNF